MVGLASRRKVDVVRSLLRKEMDQAGVGALETARALSQNSMRSTASTGCRCARRQQDIVAAGGPMELVLLNGRTRGPNPMMIAYHAGNPRLAATP
jgi:hypothetical protein